MASMRCPYCGATFEVPETVSIAVCPYCGTTVWRQSGNVLKEHYMYELRVEFNKAFDMVRRTAQRLFAAPEDVGEASTPESGYLHFIPLHLYHVRVRAGCPDNPEAGLEEGYESLLATSSPPRGLPQGYRFPTRGRRFFEPATLERGRYHQPDVDPKDLLARATERYRRKALREAQNTCEDPRLVDETRWQGIVHYPVWEVRYRYEDRAYRSLVDGSDGTVIYMEYPIGGKERGLLLGMGLGGILAGALIGLGVGAAAGHPAAGGIGGFIAGLPGAYASLRLGARRTGEYRVGEERRGEE